MERIREAYPKVKHIWEHSTLTKEGGDKAINDIMRFYEGIEKALKRGTITTDLRFQRGDILPCPHGEEPVRCPA